MDIWINNVLPSLFPYILIINIIMYLDAFNTLNNILYPIIGRVFSVSKNACFCIICGFLCGYPIGIKTINDMLEKKLICKEEANYLSVFCNNISPAFYINFIVNSNINCGNRLILEYNSRFLLILLILLPYISSFFCSFIYRTTHKQQFVYIITLCKQENVSKKYNDKQFFDKCILNSFLSLLYIGGYIIIFSIIAGFLQKIIINKNILRILTSFLEISNGSYSFRNASIEACVLLLVPLACFGGISALFQSIQLMNCRELKMSLYIKYRLINLLIAGALAFILLHVF